MSPQAAEKQRTGSCLCGAVKLSIRGKPLLTNLCHCSTCKKSSGVVFASMSFWTEQQVTYSFPRPPFSESIIKTYTDETPESGNTLKRSFCANCGSRVKIVQIKKGKEDGDGGGILGLPTGIIDGVGEEGEEEDDDLKPQREFFCYERAGWLGDVVGGADRSERMPVGGV